MGYEELLKRIADEDTQAALILSAGGGIRAVFDAASTEYQSMTMRERMDWLDLITSFGIHTRRLENAYLDVMACQGYGTDNSARNSFYEGLLDITDHLLRRRQTDGLRRLAEQAE